MERTKAIRILGLMNGLSSLIIILGLIICIIYLIKSKKDNKTKAIIGFIIIIVPFIIKVVINRIQFNMLLNM